MYDPGAHLSGCVPPGQKDPTGQSSQRNDAPEKEPVPAGQGVHGPALAPESDTVPFAQLETGVAPARQEDCSELGKDPVGQREQAAEPAVATESMGH